MSDEYRIPDDEWEQRQLCSDGNCIGVIGPDGRCKECGKPAEGGAPPPAAKDESDAAPEAPPAEAEKDETDETISTAEAPAAGTAESDSDDWSNRRLCPDGNCIGVIGPDGKCKECGRPAE
jgi:hypothetical protein